MIRLIITTLATLLTGSLLQAFFVSLPGWLNIFYLPPVILVFALRFFRPIEVIFIGLFCGFIVDALGSFVIGTNMLLMLIVAFMLSIFNVVSGRINHRQLVFYSMAVSLLYRVLLLVVQFIILGSKANIYLWQLVLGPLADGSLSFVLYLLLVKILSMLKVLDHQDYLKNRIGLRP